MSEKEPSTATAKVALKLLKDIERRGVRILSERAVEETARALDAFAAAAVQAERARIAERLKKRHAGWDKRLARAKRRGDNEAARIAGAKMGATFSAWCIVMGHAPTQIEIETAKGGDL